MHIEKNNNFCHMNTTENIAYSALRAGNTTACSAPARTKSAATQKKKRMSVEEYFGKVLKKLDQHYAAVQES